MPSLKVLPPLALILLCFSNTLPSQIRTFYEHGYQISHYDLRDPSFSQNHSFGFDIEDMYQEPDGLLWLPVAMELVKFDGYNFEVIRPPRDMRLNDSRDQFNYITKDSRGNIWASTLGAGILKYDQVKRQFSRISTGNGDSDQTLGIVQDTFGTLWAGSWAGGIFRINDGDSLQWSLSGIRSAVHYVAEPIDELFRGQRTLAGIDSIGSNRQESRTFTITKPQKVIVLGQGELNYGSKHYVDHGWLTSEAGKIIWSMQPERSYEAGSLIVNRLHIDTLTLKPGNYTLHYRTNESYAYGDWRWRFGSAVFTEPTPPSAPAWWGIRLFEHDPAIENSIWSEIADFQASGQLHSDYAYPYQDANGSIWFYGQNLEKLVPVSANKYIFEPYSDWLRQDADESWTDIVVLLTRETDQLWLGGVISTAGGSYTHTLGIFDTADRTFRRIKTGLPPEAMIHTLAQDEAGNLWMGTYDHGLHRLAPPFVDFASAERPNLKSFYLRTEEDTEGSGLPFRNRGIKSLLIDQQNNLWVGLWRNFMFRIDLDPLPYDLIDMKAITGREEARPRDAFEDSNGRLWIALDNELIRYNLSDGSVERYRGEVNGIPLGRPYPLVEIDDGERLLFLFNHLDETGIRQISMVEHNPVTNQFTERMSWDLESPFPFPDGFLINDSLLCIERGYLINYRNWTIFRELTDLIETTQDRPRRLLSTPGSERGFWVASQFQNILHLEINANGVDTLAILPENSSMLDIHQARDGTLWVSTISALKVYGFDPDTVLVFDELDGLPNRGNGIIVEDETGKIWDFTAINPAVIDPQSGKVLNLPSLSQLARKTMTIHFQHGKIYVPGQEEVYIFYPDQSFDRAALPILKLKTLTTHRYDRQREEMVSRELVIAERKQIVLPYAENNLSISFAGILFDDPKSVQYAYQMKGYQQGWQEAGHERIASYTGLPPGRYTFQVRAANGFGQWNEPSSLSIRILPPWWRTWWAYTLYVLLAAGSLFWYVQSLRRKVKEKQAQLEKEQAFSHKLERINQANQRFVPQDFLSILGKTSIEDLHLGDQTQTKMTILFSDIRSYTGLSESMSPKENFRFINGYLGRVGPVIKKHGGFINQYLGDGLMALFVNDHTQAVQAAVEMQQVLRNYNEERRRKNRPPLRTGIGLNTGQLMLGIIGDQNRYDSAVISDAVNTASRMEGLTKVFGASIIISERTLQELDAANLAHRYLGRVKVKGKDKAQKIYDVYEGDPAEIHQLKEQTKTRFEAGIAHYAGRRFGKAVECFKQVLAVYPEDKAARYYQDKSVQYIVDGVAEDWSGVEEMAFK